MITRDFHGKSLSWSCSVGLGLSGVDDGYLLHGDSGGSGGASGASGGSLLGNLLGGHLLSGGGFLSGSSFLSGSTCYKKEGKVSNQFTCFKRR